MPVEAKQKESGRRLFLMSAGLALCVALPARAGDRLDAGGLTFREFATLDNGASYGRGEGSIIAGGPNQVSSKVLAVQNDLGLARVRFEQIRVTIAMPLGWQATEDWERGVGYSSDKRYRLIVWRVDFDFEGVKDAEHYAATKAGSIQARRSAVKAQVRRLGDGNFLIVYENVPKAQGDAETRVVFDLVVPQPGNPKMGVLITLGVPSKEASRGLKLLALINQNMSIDW